MAMESLCEEEDEADEFFSMCLPLLIEQFGSMSRKRKRQEIRQVGKEIQRLGRGGKKEENGSNGKKGRCAGTCLHGPDSYNTRTWLM